MRIVVVGNGASVHVLARAEAMAARGHSVRLVTVGPVLPSSLPDVRTRDVPTGVAKAVSDGVSFLRDVRSFDPDLLHLHYAGGALGTLALLAAVRPFVVTVMGGDVLPEQHADGLPRLEKRATRRILEEADLVLVKSDGLRGAVARMAHVRAPVETVRWGVDLPRFRRDPAAGLRMRRRLGLDPDARVVLSPRSLARLYNVDVIVEAFAAVARRAPAAVLVVTEHGRDEGYAAGVRGRVEALGLGPRVRFAGVVAHADMPALYSASEVMVSVPASDGLPQSLFEAMASGTPAVLGRLPAYAEAVTDGETALLTDIAPAPVAEAILRGLEDGELRGRIVAAALRRVEEIASLPRESERVETLCAEALRAPRRRPTALTARAIEAATLLFRRRRA